LIQLTCFEFRIYEGIISYLAVILFRTKFSVFLGNTKESELKVKRYIGNIDFGARDMIYLLTMK